MNENTALIRYYRDDAGKEMSLKITYPQSCPIETAEDNLANPKQADATSPDRDNSESYCQVISSGFSEDIDWKIYGIDGIQAVENALNIVRTWEEKHGL